MGYFKYYNKCKKLHNRIKLLENFLTEIAEPPITNPFQFSNPELATPVGEYELPPLLQGKERTYSNRPPRPFNFPYNQDWPPPFGTTWTDPDTGKTYKFAPPGNSIWVLGDNGQWIWQDWY